MSGTSCDGVTAAAASISGPAGRPRVRCLGVTERAYPGALRGRLLRAAAPGGSDAAEVAALHVELAEFWAGAATRLAGGRAGLRRFDLLASHGHTLHHHPPAGRARGWSLQVGDAATLAERTGLPVVHDFRARDLALGGQGAPLVPRADAALFGHPREPRVALNLGGIANITVLPAGTTHPAWAFDTGPGNMALDALAARATRGRLRFDRGGRLAAAGHVDPGLLHAWLAHPFFRRRPPRSTGREEFGDAFLSPALEAIRRRRMRWADALATATALTALTVAAAVHAYAAPGTRLVIGAGGGMRNRALVRELRAMLSPLRLEPSDRHGVPSRAREALAFAVLGHFTWRGLPGNLPCATGATAEAVLGSVVPGRSGRIS
ncbi:MAG: anhydro-N-acetylmuramic acid kinase [Candidatus Eisenbacteria bacterium]|nr:anhydro-N-acetylmuramic acid kinase [Candidatus Eisenbacteria bacterium]